MSEWILTSTSMSMLFCKPGENENERKTTLFFSSEAHEGKVIGVEIQMFIGEELGNIATRLREAANRLEDFKIDR